MSIGGPIIEVVATQPGVSRLWAVDLDGVETCLHFENARVMPKVQDVAFFDNGYACFWDREGKSHDLKPVGWTHEPGGCGEAAE
jgi:hypothetical protein